MSSQPHELGLNFRRGNMGTGKLILDYRGEIPPGYVLVPKGDHKLTNQCRARTLNAGMNVYLYVSGNTNNRVCFHQLQILFVCLHSYYPAH